jgi:hypothetical protein
MADMLKYLTVSFGTPETVRAKRKIPMARMAPTKALDDTRCRTGTRDIP